MMRWAGFALGLWALIAASSAHAATFLFSYRFDLGTELTGSLNGTAVGNQIVGLSNISVSVEGLPFTGSGSLSQYSWDPAALQWVAGGAYLSFDGANNNFQFSDATMLYDWTNQFFGITGDAASNPVAGPQIAYGHPTPFNGYIGLGDFPPNGSWSVSMVPEPASWAMMLIGFGFIGAMLRRARAKSFASAG